jgi:uncharacterized membrane protein
VNLVHTPTFRFNTVLFCGFLVLSALLWLDMPERYPVHFDLGGRPTRWAEGSAGMWILLVAICALSFGKLHLFQRFLINDPDSPLLNVPYKELFHRLPRDRKVPVIRRVNRMLGLLNAGMLLVFISLLFLVYYSAHNPDSVAAFLANYTLVAIIVAVTFVPLGELLALRRTIIAPDVA